MSNDAECVFDPGREEWLMSVREAATRLGVSSRTIYRMIGDGTFSPVRVRHSTRIRGSDLASLLSEPPIRPERHRTDPSIRELLAMETIPSKEVEPGP
jgi:excisionase family DNA binding protein